MKTDLPLKQLFCAHPRDFLPLLGDAGATVKRATVIEIPRAARRIDTVIELHRGGEIYFRHVEFQAQARAGDPWRWFEYSTLLHTMLRRPVLTTIIRLFVPGGARAAPALWQPDGIGHAAFEMRLAGAVVNRWRFGVLDLWRTDAELALRADAGAGVAALVPLMAGGEQIRAIERAVQKIRRGASPAESPDLLALLSVFAGRRYSFAELERIVGRQAMIQSSFWDKALAEGRAAGRAEGRAKGVAEGRAKGVAEGRAKGVAEGKAEGELAALVQVCLDVARNYHPAVVRSVGPKIRGCADRARLHEWILQGPRLDAAAFVDLVTRPRRRRPRV